MNFKSTRKSITIIKLQKESLLHIISCHVMILKRKSIPVIT